MARGINKVILIGNAGNDAEVRFMPSGAAVANVNIATSESWKDKESGEMQERTEWHRVTFMDRGNFRLGQIAGDFIKKGSKVYVEGSLRTREWEKDGIKRYTTEIVASEMQLLDGKQDNQGQQAGNSGGYGQQAPAQPASYGGNGQGGFGDPWAGLVPAGEAKQNGATIEAIKNHKDIQGDAAKAQQFGWVEKQVFGADDFDDSIPF